MYGYTGKILRVDLTTRKVSTIDTDKYADKWVGGHGLGSAIFWDLCKKKDISGFDPANVVTIMTSPLSGTITPSCSGRTEVQGIGVQSYPVEWFTRSNFGGRFSAMLKFAGWDGIVIEGKADKPVWIDIVDGDARIEDASWLWGLDTWATQEEIWRRQSTRGYTEWRESGTARDKGRTTQRAAILTIGPAGEHLSRTACLVHDAGNGSGQGGFGGVWGAKNLKAISVVGTGSVSVADPGALFESRLWSKENYAMDPDQPTTGWTGGRFGTNPAVVSFWQKPEGGRPQSCFGCISGCRGRYPESHGNESSCVETSFYGGFDLAKHGKQTSAAHIASDLLQKYGINAYEAFRGLQYIRDLNKMGVFGPGKQIDCPLDFNRLGEVDFVDQFLHMIAYREGVGDDMAEGFFRAAKRWGRLEADSASGVLPYPYWGLPEHAYDPRAELEWGYGTILGDRDINEHDFNGLYWDPSKAIWRGQQPYLSADQVTKIISDKLRPYEGDQLMLDYSTENAYSEHMVKLVLWHRHYTRFWKESALYCDFRWPDFFNASAKDNIGITPDGEPRFFENVTGRKLTFEEGVELGRKIWNLDNAIWTLQGRHRDMVHFSPYIYQVPFAGGDYGSYWLPGRENGEWKYINVTGRCIDKEKFEEWKTQFYKAEGWDTATGWPTRETLEKLGLKEVADELEANNKLGK
ncbi:MAG: aldehyde ferredoxin oxidoreductase N-terminal domain-containing protein [Bacteroidota bacterium]